MPIVFNKAKKKLGNMDVQTTDAIQEPEFSYLLYHTKIKKIILE